MLAYGAAIELAQWAVGWRFAELADLAADAVGVAGDPPIKSEDDNRPPLSCSGLTGASMPDQRRPRLVAQSIAQLLQQGQQLLALQRIER